MLCFVLNPSIFPIIFRTALHWAAKRGQKDVVSYLLKHGADKKLLTSKEETPLALATKPEVRILLGGEPGVTINTAIDLPIVPNYIKNEPIDARVSDLYPAPSPRSQTSSTMTSSSSQNIVTTSSHSVTNNSSSVSTPPQPDGNYSDMCVFFYFNKLFIFILNSLKLQNAQRVQGHTYCAKSDKILFLK